MTLIVVFPVLPFMLTTAKLCPAVSVGDYFDFLQAEFAFKLSEYFGSIWRVGVNRWVFLPPLSATFVGTKPLPFLPRLVTFPAVIAELHTLRSIFI